MKDYLVQGTLYGLIILPDDCDIADVNSDVVRLSTYEELRNGDIQFEIKGITECNAITDDAYEQHIKYLQAVEIDRSIHVLEQAGYVVSLNIE